MNNISEDEFQKYWTLLSQEEKMRLAKSFMGHFISTPSDQGLPSRIWNELVLKWNPEINKDWLIKNWRYKNEMFYDQAV